MAKRKLNLKQQRQIRQNQQDLLDGSGSSDQPFHTGIILAQIGKTYVVDGGDGELITCQKRSTVDPTVCGDEVLWQRISADVGVIVTVNPRQSLLSRIGFQGKKKLVAANIDRLLVVSSVLPEVSFYLIDCYLVAAELLDIDVVLVVNKVDLLNDEQREDYEAQFEIYRQLGYTVRYISADQQLGMKELSDELIGHRGVLLGQSGVGKTSIIAALIPDVEVQVQRLSERSAQGQHTTSVSCLYRLPGGGELIDSPGVRQFQLWRLELPKIDACFREFRHYLGQCRFNNCSHRREPDCAIMAAVAAGDISQQRYQHFLKIGDEFAL